MANEETSYDTAAIRDLLLGAFSPQELRWFCEDRKLFRPIVVKFGEKHGLDDMVGEVIDYCRTRLLWEELLDELEQVRPKQVVRHGLRARRRTPAKVFLSYSQHAETDQRLAHYLNQLLSDHGHEVFMDAGLRVGEPWLDELDRWLRASDFLVVLLSKESADSEMVQAEVQRAYQYRKRYGHPHAFPVRIAYEGILPHSIDWFLSSVQYAIWRDEGDNERVGLEVLEAIEGRLEDREPVQIRPLADGFELSEDGRPVATDDSLTKPLPEVDPRFLEELEAPGGAVKLRDRFYIERVEDARLRNAIAKPGTTTTIRAARQTGKTSLLVRGARHARERGFQIVRLDLQRMDQNRLESPDLFLRDLGEFIVRKVRLDVDQVDRVWRGSLGPQVKLTDLLETYVLPEAEVPILLALDEADRLLQTGYHRGFFGMIRSWHNSRADDDVWNKLNIVLVISTEPYLLIPNLSQSPFNVGLSLYLRDFTREQVRRLNRLHGYPVKNDHDFSHLMTLFGGHPYLTRKALYTMVVEGLSWTDLVHVAPTDGQHFGDHLRHHYSLLQKEPELREALRQIIRHECSDDETSFFRLLQAGLVKGRGDVCRCRCDLYRIYFEDKL